MKQADARTSLDVTYDVRESPVRPRSATLVLPRRTLPPPTAAYRDHVAASVARTARRDAAVQRYGLPTS